MSLVQRCEEVACGINVPLVFMHSLRKPVYCCLRQDLTIAGQLRAGIRVLDLRLTISDETVKADGKELVAVGDVVTAHTYICRPLTEDLEQV